MKKGLYLSLVLSSLFFAACETRVINRGYIIDSAEFASIVVGQDTEDSIFAKFGSPTMRSTVASQDGSFSWYYVSKKLEKKSFLDAEVVDKKTKIVTFDRNGVVTSVTTSTYEDSVKMSKESTRDQGKGAGIFNETFGGLGKYRERYSSGK